MKESLSEGDYVRSSKTDHYFGNTVGIVRLAYNDGFNDIEDVDAFLEASKKEFIIDGICGDMKFIKQIKYNENELKGIFEVAKGDWKNVETIKNIYKKMYEIRSKKYNEDKLFKQNDSIVFIFL